MVYKNNSTRRLIFRGVNVSMARKNLELASPISHFLGSIGIAGNFSLWRWIGVEVEFGSRASALSPILSFLPNAYPAKESPAMSNKSSRGIASGARADF